MQFTGKFIIFLNVLASTEQEVLDQQDFQFTDGPTYGYVHGGWVLKACELSIQCIYILFGEADHTLDVPQLEVNQKEKITMQLQSFPTNTWAGVLFCTNAQLDSRSSAVTVSTISALFSARQRLARLAE